MANFTPPPRQDLLAWGTVRAGLGLTFFGILLVFLCSALFVVLAMSHPAEVRKIPLLVLMAYVLSGMGLLAGLVLTFTGVCMTPVAPTSSGARTWAMLATICAFLFLILSVVLMLAGADSHARHMRQVQNVTVIDDLKLADNPPFADQELNTIRILTQVCAGVGFICYLLCLRAIAASFGRRGLALAVVAYLLLLILAVGGLNFLVYQQAQQGPPTADQVEMMAKIALGGVIVLGLWGMITIAAVRRGISRGLLQAE